MSQRKLKEALILGAGFGTRMGPLTKDKAKPMLDFGKRTLFDWTIHYLSRHGINRFAVNTHYQRKAFEDFLQDRKAKREIEIYSEKDEILGTGGGILNMRNFPEEDDFVVINCDFLTNIDLEAAFEFHIQKKALATLVLVQPDNDVKYSSVEVGEDHRIQNFLSTRDKSPWIFSGIHILRREIFDFAPQKKSFCVIRDWYMPALERGEKILGFRSKDVWLDVGEKDLYEKERVSFEKTPFPWLVGQS